MADPKTNLRVRITADLAQFQQGLGAVRKSISGLGGVLAGALAGVSVGAVMASIVRATAESEAAVAQLEARLKSTKGAVGLTSNELQNMASGLQAVTTYGDEAIIGVQTMLLNFGKIGKETFPQATEAVLNLSTSMGKGLTESAQIVGRALEAPAKAARALRAANIELSPEQQKVIKLLVETGREADAQRLIFQALEKAHGNAARAARDTMGGAFTALKEAAGDLLEGDSGSDGVRGVKNSIESLTRLLQDPRTKESFAKIASGVFELANAFVVLTTKAQEAWTATQRWLTFKMGGTKSVGDLKQIRFEMAELNREIEEIERKQDKTGAKGFFEPHLNARRLRLRELKSQEDMSLLLFGDGTPERNGFVENGRSSTAGKGRWSNINGNVDTAALAAQGDAADKARKKAEALRKEHDRLRKEADAAEDARKAELNAMKERVAEGLRDVEIALDRASGDEAGAALKEIEDRYKKLLAELGKLGNEKGKELVERLINIDKFQVKLDEVKRRFGEGLEQFTNPAPDFDPNTQNAGDMIADEAAIEAARQKGLATMRASREELLKLYNTTSGPAKEAALAAIRELDVTVEGLKKRFSETTLAAADMAVAGVADFFYDWASGAKSFKNALGDAVDSFVKGMLRMTTEAAALVLVLKGFDLFMPGFSQFFMQLKGGSAISRHGGGLVTGSGGMRHNLNPLLFGNAPRYHSGGFAGLRPNEVAAVLEKGEEVLTEDDPRHAKNGGKGRGGDVIVNVQNNSSTPAQVNERMSGGDRIIEVVIGAVASDIGRNGAVGKAIGQRFGVQPVGALRG